MIFLNCRNHGNLRVETLYVLQDIRSGLCHGNTADQVNVNAAQHRTQGVGNGALVEPVE